MAKKKIKKKITKVREHPMRVPISEKNPEGEAKEFIFNDIRQKDLRDPNIAIPMGIRWLIYKSKRASAKLGREPTHEEIILEYKGLLKSKSQYKQNALNSYRKYHGKLKGK